MSNEETNLDPETGELETGDTSTDNNSPVDDPPGDDTPEEDVPFTPEELRYIKIHTTAYEMAQRSAKPIEMIIPEQAPITFSGTYSYRPHWIEGTRAVVIAPLLILIITILAFMAGSYLLSVLLSIPKMDAQFGISRSSEWLTLWIPLAVSLIVAIRVIWLAFPWYLEWFYTKRTVSKTQVVLSLVVPGVIKNMLFKIDDYNEKINRADVRNVKIVQTGLGEFLGYATVTFETWAQTDNAFHKIRYVSHPEVLRELFPIDNLGESDI